MGLAVPALPNLPLTAGLSRGGSGPAASAVGLSVGRSRYSSAFGHADRPRSVISSVRLLAGPSTTAHTQHQIEVPYSPPVPPPRGFLEFGKSVVVIFITAWHDLAPKLGYSFDTNAFRR